MKSKIIKSVLCESAGIPFLMLVLLLSSIALTSFHNHHCDSTTDNCTICSYRVSYSAVIVELIQSNNLFTDPLSEHIIVLNDRVTDPSQKLVCSSHAPPHSS